MSRGRALSDPTSPTMDPRQRDPSTTSPTSSLTAESLARLSLVSRPARWHHSTPSPAQPPAWLETSVTPSVTSISDEDEKEGEIDVSMNEDRVKAWIRKGKFKATDGVEGTVDGAKKCDAGSLPPEILLQVFRCLSSPIDLNNALLVSRMWSLCAYPVLWQHPNIHSVRQLSNLTRVLKSPTSTFTYARSIRRLNLSALGNTVSNPLIEGLENCTRLERLTITNTDNVSSSAFRWLVNGMSELHAVDFSGCSGVDSKVLSRLADSCLQLQGLNLSKCESVDDEGIEAIAENGLPLRRIKLPGCKLVTDSSMVKLIVACPLLMEVDVASLPRVHNATLYAAFLHSTYIREIKICAHTGSTSNNLSDAAFPNLARLISRETRLEEDDFLAAYIRAGGLVKPPSCLNLEYLRVIDLTGNKLLTDAAIDQLIINAPKLRHLALTKCEELTDQAMLSVAKLGKHLHHIHLGHVAKLTDEGIRTLVTSCIRIRYLDIACCPLITDQSIHDLSQNLPKLRRIGLVKVVKLTDEGLYSLTSRSASLERIHLSYCENVSVKAVACLLNRLHLLNHLSLTGVGAFCNPELQQYCRQTPPGLNEHQTSSFCVFSSHGIAALRAHLNSRLAEDALHSDQSERSGSVSSSSSITVPAETPSPPGSASRLSTPNMFNARQAVTFNRRNSRHRWRDTTGIPNSAFSSAATFLAPEIVQRPLSGNSSRNRTHRFSTARAYREEHRQVSQTSSSTQASTEDGTVMDGPHQSEPVVLPEPSPEMATIHPGERGSIRGIVSAADDYPPTTSGNHERVIRPSRARDSLIAAVPSSSQRPATDSEASPKRPLHARQPSSSSPFRWMVDSYKRWGASEAGGSGEGSGSVGYESGEESTGKRKEREG